MCVLCDRARAQAFQGGDLDIGRVMKGLSIAPSLLIDEGSAALTRQFTATDGVLDFYLHMPGGSVAINGGEFGQQVIQSLSIPEEDLAFFRSIVERLDAILDLDFRESATAAGADVDLYYDTKIDLGDDYTGSNIGFSTPSESDGWELFISQSDLADDENLRRYVLVHELGHALGLEHPFDAEDGDTVNGSTDPWASAFPEETVMAYRLPSNGEWPEFFTENDLQALVQLWGAEPRVVDGVGDISPRAASFKIGPDGMSGVFAGSGSRRGFTIDRLLDSDAEDYAFGSDDLIQGGDGADVLIGGAGDDGLFGGDGDDLIRGGDGSDVLDGGAGNDQLWGDRGADLFRLSAGFDVIRGFDAGEGDRLELTSALSYRVAQGFRGVEISTAMGSTTLMGLSLASFDPSAINLV